MPKPKRLPQDSTNITSNTSTKTSTGSDPKLIKYFTGLLEGERRLGVDTSSRTSTETSTELGIPHRGQEAP